MFSLLEIARIYKATWIFADLQGPMAICFKDPQNKGIISQFIRYNRIKFAYHFRINYDLNLETAEFLALILRSTITTRHFLRSPKILCYIVD